VSCRIQSAVGRYFREYLTCEGFTEIHSPKLLGAASEGGADVFRLKYFGREACLAQSPQLYKQMALCCDLHKVFEVGPVFRAEVTSFHVSSDRSNVVSLNYQVLLILVIIECEHAPSFV